jgi:hypothetical protein
MNNITPTNEELNLWYNEALKFPSIIESLNNYQKGKLIEFCYNKILRIIEVAIGILNVKPDNEYPENIPYDKHLLYIMNTTFKYTNSDSIYVLNLLGYTWTPEESLIRINSESPIFNPIQFKLKDNYFDTVLNALKDYFKEEQHEELFKLLEGKEINNSLMFNGNKNQLTELFKRLEYNDLIIIPITKLELAKWIEKNFTTQKGDFNFNQVYSEELSKTSFKIPTSKRILNSIECLSENKLKERNEINQNKSPLT